LDDIERARAEVEGAPEVDKLRLYHDHPGFVDPMVDNVRASLVDLPAGVRDDAHLAFVAHSIPDVMNAASGPGGGAYVAQLAETARLVCEGLAKAEGRPARPWKLVYCSRSGSPHTPWLEPDISDHLGELASGGVPAAVIVPIGFVSDHLEVIYDLDTEAMERAKEVGLPTVRAATAGTDPRFVGMVRELLCERTQGAAPRRLGDETLSRGTCSPDCCRVRATP
jgi:ferrochelatase